MESRFRGDDKRSRVVAMTRSFVIALDVGGSSVKSGVVRLPDMQVSGQVRTPLDSRGPADPILRDLASCALRQAEGLAGPAAGLALAFPGPFDYETGICRIAGVSKFEALYGLDIRRELARRTGFLPARIAFINDAEAAIAGEIHHGSAKKFERVIGVTLGTGLGSGFFVDGVRQTSGPGVPGNGGWLFDERFKGMMADDRFSIRGLGRRLAEGSAPFGSPEQAAAAARRGDASAKVVFLSFGRDFAHFLRPYAEAFRADAVLVGGGVGGAFDLFGPALAEGLPVAVVPSALGMDAPLLGATDAFLARSGSPSAPPPVPE
jgi:glucokinase